VKHSGVGCDKHLMLRNALGAMRTEGHRREHNAARVQLELFPGESHLGRVEEAALHMQRSLVLAEQQTVQHVKQQQAFFLLFA
jgi:hypothetical protein